MIALSAQSIYKKPMLFLKLLAVCLHRLSSYLELALFGQDIIKYMRQFLCDSYSIGYQRKPLFMDNTGTL
ncbi:MAG: hypothetical protein OEW00_13005 [candidate division Zixibacteria bacterium]|nr:hypothetical protein [candidate division Zixibacteria bacterium]